MHITSEANTSSNSASRMENGNTVSVLLEPVLRVMMGNDEYVIILPHYSKNDHISI